MIIKATQLQVWAPAGGGGGESRPSPPLSRIKKVFWLYWGPFCYVFLIFGGIFTHVRTPISFCYFYFMGGGAFFWACPPLRKFLRTPMIARRIREHAPRKFCFGEWNLAPLHKIIHHSIYLKTRKQSSHSILQNYQQFGCGTTFMSGIGSCAYQEKTFSKVPPHRLQH